MKALNILIVITAGLYVYGQPVKKATIKTRQATINYGMVKAKTEPCCG